MSSQSSSTLKVVVVDDHSIVRVGLRMLLDTWSEIELVGEGRDGVEAVELVEALSPDIVLMDIAMPIIDGIEASRRIRAFNKDVRIIMLTSHTDVKVIQASLAAGVNGYCLKDVSDDRLKRAIMSVVEGDVWLDARASKDILRIACGDQPTDSKEVSAAADKPDEEAADSEDKTYGSLSSREMEVLRLLVQGLTNKEIGKKLFITRDTVKTHIRHIMEKLAVNDRTEAAVKAVRCNMV
ncbi:MAG: response regulator [Candidatus Obscuribacterales bacterium]